MLDREIYIFPKLSTLVLNILANYWLIWVDIYHPHIIKIELKSWQYLIGIFFRFFNPEFLLYDSGPIFDCLSINNIYAAHMRVNTHYLPKFTIHQRWFQLDHYLLNSY